MTDEEIQKTVLDRAERAASVIGAQIVSALYKVLSVPAPYKISPSGRYVATVAATPGAPPRKLSGKGRASVTYFVERDSEGLTLWVGTPNVYMAAHERHGNHVWLYKTVMGMMPEIKANFEKRIAGN